MDKQLLNTKEASKFLGVSKQFLERDRHMGARIPYVQIGARAVRYRVSDLDEYLEANLTKAVG